MNRVERPETEGLNHAGRVEERIVAANQVVALQQAPGTGNGGASGGPYRAQDFRTCDRHGIVVTLRPEGTLRDGGAFESEYAWLVLARGGQAQETA